MNVLVTGGAGFLGSWLVESLLRRGDSVSVIDNLSPQVHGGVPAPQLSWLDHPSLRFERDDVRNTNTLDRLLADCEIVVHLAAETGTGQSMYEIEHYYDVNVQATANLLQLVGNKHRHVRRVVIASSRSVYGEGAYRLNGEILIPSPRSASQLAAGQWDPTGPNSEKLELIATPEYVSPRPASIYAATKLAVEQLCCIFAETYGVRVAALRFQNIYGERQSLRNPYTGILSIFSNRMRQNLPINIFEDGAESRDFVHVSDVVRAIEFAMHAEYPGYVCLNVGSGQATSVADITAQMKHLLKSSSDIAVTGDYRLGDIRHCFADLSSVKSILGFEPVVSLDQGLERFVRWVLTQAVVKDASQEAQRELASRGLGRAGD